MRAKPLADLLSGDTPPSGSKHAVYRKKNWLATDNKLGNQND